LRNKLLPPPSRRESSLDDCESSVDAPPFTCKVSCFSATQARDHPFSSSLPPLPLPHQISIGGMTPSGSKHLFLLFSQTGLFFFVMVGDGPQPAADRRISPLPTPEAAFSVFSFKKRRRVLPFFVVIEVVTAVLQLASSGFFPPLERNRFRFRHHSFFPSNNEMGDTAVSVFFFPLGRSGNVFVLTSLMTNCGAPASFP